MPWKRLEENTSSHPNFSNYEPEREDLLNSFLYKERETIEKIEEDLDKTPDKISCLLDNIFKKNNNDTEWIQKKEIVIQTYIRHKEPILRKFGIHISNMVIFTRGFLSHSLEYLDDDLRSSLSVYVLSQYKHAQSQMMKMQPIAPYITTAGFLVTEPVYRDFHNEINNEFQEEEIEKKFSYIQNATWIKDKFLHTIAKE